MSANPSNPALYEINTRLWLSEIGRALGRIATLDDVPEATIERIARLGFDWVWLLGVWRPGEASRRVSRGLSGLLAELRRVLPDLTEADICGSCFAIDGYAVDPRLGGEPALDRLRDRLARCGLRLMLDFIPNHVALDHPWVRTHPDRFVRGSEADLAREPDNWCRLPALEAGTDIFAHGRDPYFPGWPDTLQLNYGSPDLQAAMRNELMRVAGLCDGVRCDMAMLILPEVFRRTWKIEAAPFWPEVIETVRTVHPDFCFMAEVYWGLEATLQQQGFDYTYDKGLYDALRQSDAPAVRGHLAAPSGFQHRLVRFLENHDEARAAVAFPQERHEAAAGITFLVPGMRLLHYGQLDGRRVRVPVHLCRGPDEPVDEERAAFYTRLLEVLRCPTVRDGTWYPLAPLAAWAGNESWNSFIACAWRGRDGDLLLVAANYAPTDGQCYVRLPFPDVAHQTFRLSDRMGPAVYERDGGHLISPGLYLDLPGWGYHVFTLEPTGSPSLARDGATDQPPVRRGSSPRSSSVAG
jgi:Alpha amylase, catalytic domain